MNDMDQIFIALRQRRSADNDDNPKIRLKLSKQASAVNFGGPLESEGLLDHNTDETMMQEPLSSQKPQILGQVFEIQTFFKVCLKFFHRVLGSLCA